MLMQKTFFHSSEKAYFHGSKVKTSLSYRKILMKIFDSPVKHPLFVFQQIVLTLSDRQCIHFYNNLLTQTTAEHIE